jgi:hypothetical protein
LEYPTSPEHARSRLDESLAYLIAGLFAHDDEPDPVGELSCRRTPWR